MADSSLPTISINSYSAYLGLRSCAGGCLLNNGFLSSYAADLVSYIGCEKGRYNTCYCNLGIVTEASSFVSGCVSKSCSEVADVSSAVQAWEGYCAGAGYPLANPAVTTVETFTSDSVTQRTTLVATVSSTVAPISTPMSSGAVSSFQTSSFTVGAAASSSSSPASNAQSTSTSASSVPAQSNTAAIAGGVVGGVAALGLTAVIIVMLILRERRRNRREELAANAAWQAPPPSEPTTEKMVKTPVVVSSAPFVSATHTAHPPPIAVVFPRTLDGGSSLARTGPELDGMMRLGNELDGRGGFALRRNVNEMQG